MVLVLFPRQYDMSFGGVTFYGKGGPYAKFAGRDASRALATMKLEDEAFDNADISNLEENQLKVLDDWIRKFEDDKGYPVVGTLKK
jgi:membrane-associated progesterone receptor component